MRIIKHYWVGLWSTILTTFMLNQTNVSLYLFVLTILNALYVNYFILFILIFLGIFFKSYKSVYFLLILSFWKIFKIWPQIPIYTYFTLPTTLWIGTINIHPPLLYSIGIFIIYKQINMHNPITPISTFGTYRLLTYWSFITLILGGLWGFQSNIWGYIWANDTIEWLLFLIVIFGLLQLHTIGEYQNIEYSYLHIFIIISLLITIRLNLLPTRHSFLLNLTCNYKILFVIDITMYTILFNHIKLQSNMLILPYFFQLVLGFLMYVFMNKFLIVQIFTYNVFYLIVLSSYLLYEIQTSKVFIVHWSCIIFIYVWKAFHTNLIGIFTIQKKLQIITWIKFYKTTLINHFIFVQHWQFFKLLDLTTLFINHITTSFTLCTFYFQCLMTTPLFSYIYIFTIFSCLYWIV